jgi:hypothetical protein
MPATALNAMALFGHNPENGIPCQHFVTVSGWHTWKRSQSRNHGSSTNSGGAAVAGIRGAALQCEYEGCCITV